MKAKKRKPVFYIVVTILILIAGLAYYIYLGFNGSLLQKFLMTQSAKKYVSENYTDQELEVDFANYDFKMNGYYCRVKSPVSEDTCFNVYKDRAGELTDDYDLCVTQKENTIFRIAKSIEEYVDQYFEENYPHRTSLVMCDFKDLYSEESRAGFEIDMPFDVKNIPAELTLTVWAETSKEEPDFEELAEYLRETELFARDMLPAVKYFSMTVQDHYTEIDGGYSPEDVSKDVTVFDVPASVIDSDELETYLAKEKERQDQEKEDLQSGK